MKNFYRYFTAIFFFLIMGCISLIFATIGLDPHHDGILYKPALDVSRGLMLFKDTYTQYGALTTLIQALSIKIFGETVLSLHIITAFFYAGIAFLLCLIWNRFLNMKWTAVSLLLFVFLAPYFDLDFFPWSSVYALFFLCLSLYLTILYYEKNRLIYLLISGISCALVFWCRQPVGIFLFIALSAGIVISLFLRLQNYQKVIKNYSIFLIGFLFSNSIFFIWLIHNAALKDWWLQSIYFAYIFKEIYGGTLLHIPGALFPVFLSSFWSILPIINIIFLIKLLLNIKIIDNKKFNILITISIVCLASWLQYYPIATSDHAYWAAVPIIGLLIYFLNLLFEKEKRFIRIIFVLLLLFGLLNAELYKKIYSGYEKISKAGYFQISQNTFLAKVLHKRFFDIKTVYFETKSPATIVGLRLPMDTIIFYEKLSNELNCYLKTYSNRGFLNLTPDLLYNTLIEKDYSFHPIKMYWENLKNIYPDYEEKQSQYVKLYKPIIIKYRDGKVSGYRIKCILNSPYKDIERGSLYILEPEKG